MEMWLLVLVLCKAAVAHQFSRTPSNITATVGDRVVLRCGVDQAEAGPVQWMKDGFGLGPGRELQGFPSYSIVADTEGTSRDWDLTISTVSLTDDAIYQCQAPPPLGTSPPARLHVQVPPSAPQLSLEGRPGSSLTVVEGKPAQLTCQAQGRPQPQLRLEGARGQVLGRNQTARRVTGGKLYRTTAVLSWIPSREQDNSSVTCTATVSTSHSGPSQSSSSALIRLRFRPRVELQHLGGVREGDSLTYQCVALAYPPVQNLEWRVGGRVQEAGTGGVLTIEAADRGLQDVVVQCRAHSEVGEGRDEMRISLDYGPVLVVTPSSLEARLGEEVRLSCRAESRPPPSYNWTRAGRKVGTGPHLDVVASSMTEGDYVCHAWAEDFSIVSSPPATLRLLAPPVISLPEVVTASLGSPVSLQCRALSASSSLTITWSKDGRTLRGPGITVTREQWQATSEYRIDNLDKEHLGRYGCLAESSEGPEFRDYRIVSLEEGEEAIALTTVLVTSGFLVLSLLLLALTSYILVLRRKRPGLPTVQPPPLVVAHNKYGEQGRLNNDSALLADLLSTRVKGVPGDLLLPAAAQAPELALDNLSRRSSLLSSARGTLELMVCDDKVLSPGYYCQTAAVERADSPVPSDSGIYSPPTSITPWLEEDILPKILKPRENWTEATETPASNKVETSV